ncbi:hypothetical protein L6R52_18485 [Myxococcota bacterium]|nr:hypothetical protein [Myxococcota bacterium]
MHVHRTPRLFALVVVALGACATNPSPATQPADPVEPPAIAADAAPSVISGDPARERFLSECTPRCEQARAMRAVGWQVIQAECERLCDAEWQAKTSTAAQP